MCHICLSLNWLSFDFFDLNDRKFLAMTHRPVVSFAALHFESDRLWAALMLYDIGQNRRILKRVAKSDLAVIAGQEHTVKRKGLTGLGGKTFNLEGIARGHPILFSTCLN